MRDIGRFRTVGEDDLLRFGYEGNASKLRRDYLNLRALGLVERRTVSVGQTRKPLPVYTLTRDGKKALKNAKLDRSGQALYAGFVKPREAAHDAAIYRMFQAEAARIEAQGGRVIRVVLDFEFKKKVYSELAKAHGLGARQYADRQAEIAAANGLAVVDGKIPLPDLRIEYETAEREQARIDLELATEPSRSLIGKGPRRIQDVRLHFHVPRIAGRVGRPRNHRRDFVLMTSALQAFGYTDTEARFLELVIRIGGYFVRRQFNQFAACKTGKRAQDFVQKLLANGHARMTVNRHARQVIHVHFKRSISRSIVKKTGTGGRTSLVPFWPGSWRWITSWSTRKPCCWSANPRNEAT